MTLTYSRLKWIKLFLETLESHNFLLSRQIIIIIITIIISIIIPRALIVFY